MKKYILAEPHIVEAIQWWKPEDCPKHVITRKVTEFGMGRYLNEPYCPKDGTLMEFHGYLLPSLGDRGDWVHPGNWIVFAEDRDIEVLTNEEFWSRYKEIKDE
jgi:hypothetical protein